MAEDYAALPNTEMHTAVFRISIKEWSAKKKEELQDFEGAYRFSDKLSSY